MITASALKRNCGYPRALSKLPPTTAKERDARARRDAAAEKGTLFHAAVELWSSGGALPQVHDGEVQGWLDLLATTWRPLPGMVFELAMGLRPDGTGVVCDEPEPHVYVARDGSELLTAGRADVVRGLFIRHDRVEQDGRSSLLIEHHLVIVRDWKTGKWSVDPPGRNLQTSALAIAACSIAGADGFMREIHYTRDGHTDADVEPVLAGTPEYAALLEEVRAAALLDDQPRPGPHCEGCWESRMRRCAHALVAA
jgi:hypothetical protein